MRGCLPRPRLTMESSHSQHGCRSTPPVGGAAAPEPTPPGSVPTVVAVHHTVGGLPPPDATPPKPEQNYQTDQGTDAVARDSRCSIDLRGCHGGVMSGPKNGEKWKTKRGRNVDETWNHVKTWNRTKPCKTQGLLQNLVKCWGSSAGKTWTKRGTDFVSNLCPDSIFRNMVAIHINFRFGGWVLPCKHCERLFRHAGGACCAVVLSCCRMPRPLSCSRCSHRWRPRQARCHRQ